MRQIFLIRHGKPNIPAGVRMCLGSTDLELGLAGHLQACLLAESMKDIPLSHVFCSKLVRSQETASYLTDQPIILPGLEESYFGDWDGLTFDVIKERWPKLYEARSKDRSLLPDGTEPDEASLLRFTNAVNQALTLSTGDIAIVAHRNVNLVFLSSITGKEKTSLNDLGYCSVSRIEWDEKTHVFTVKEIGEMKLPKLTDTLCKKLLDTADIPQNIIRHCEAVAQKAIELCEKLEEKGYYFNRNHINAAALLHDIARLEKHHAKAGENLIRTLGYPEIAEIIGQHHDLKNKEILDETAIVYMADRCIQEDQCVTLQERFQKSEKKCQTEAAKKAFLRRYEEALYLKNKINSICGKEIIQ